MFFPSTWYRLGQGYSITNSVGPDFKTETSSWAGHFQRSIRRRLLQMRGIFKIKSTLFIWHFSYNCSTKCLTEDKNKTIQNTENPKPPTPTNIHTSRLAVLKANQKIEKKKSLVDSLTVNMKYRLTLNCSVDLTVFKSFLPLFTLALHIKVAHQAISEESKGKQNTSINQFEQYMQG